MPEVEPAFEGVVLALLFRLVFKFDVNLIVAAVTGAGSFVITAWYGPGFVPPDWWLIELVISSAVTLALLGMLQIVRAQH